MVPVDGKSSHSSLPEGFDTISLSSDFSDLSSSNAEKSIVSKIQRSFSYRQPMCPFISSTFSDFQAERDILMKKVFPALNSLCKDRGTYCNPVDLRWGINDSQVDSNLVIQLCLDIIKQSAPFFVCMLGERYGTHRPEHSPPLPKSYDQLDKDAHWLDKNFLVAASAGYDWILGDTYQNCSVTELEVIQAAILGDGEFCRFYFRDAEHTDRLFTDLPVGERMEALKLYQAENQYAEIRLRDLKNRIIKKGLPIQHFCTPEDFANCVMADWKEIIDKLYPPIEKFVSDTYTERFAEWMAHETFARTRRQVFVKTKEISEIFEKLTKFAMSCQVEDSQQKRVDLFDQTNETQSYYTGNQSPGIMLMIGDKRGCGKTAVLANWISEFVDTHAEVKVITHYIGSSGQSSDISVLMRRVALEMRETYPEPGICESDVTDSTDNYMDIYHQSEMFLAALSLGSCVLVIDGVDELSTSCGLTAQQVKEMSWLPPRLPPACRVIISTCRSDSTYTYLTQRVDVTHITVPLLTDIASRQELITGHLAIHHKSLSDQQLDSILKSRLSDCPLFLCILANELRVFGVYRKLDEILESYLKATTIKELWSRIIARWIKDYGWTVDKGSDTGSDSPDGEADSKLTGWVADALRLIAVSRVGLKQEEILSALDQMGYCGKAEVTPLNWAVFRSAALDNLFQRPGGLLTFHHNHFKEAVEYLLFGSVTSEYKDSYRNKLSEPEIDLSLPPKVQQYSPSAKAGQPPNRKMYHEHLAHYFLCTPYSERTIDELPWQLLMAGDFEMLHNVITFPRLFLDLNSADIQISGRRLQLVQYWKQLSEAGYKLDVSCSTMVKGVSVSHEGEGEGGGDGENTVVENEESVTERTPSACLPSRSHTPISAVGGSRGPTPGPAPPMSSGRAIATPLSMGGGGRSVSSGRAMSGGHSVAIYTPTPSASTDKITQVKQFDKKKFTFFEDKQQWDELSVASLLHSTGKFLSERGFFKTSEILLLDANHYMTENCPLEENDQRTQCMIQESLADLYRYQLQGGEAKKWYKRALDTVNDLLDGLLDAAAHKRDIETKGRILIVLSEMNIYSCHYQKPVAKHTLYDHIENMLQQAKRCMSNAGSITGQASVQYYLAKLRVEQQKFVDAQDLFKEAIFIRERWYGKSHPVVAEILNDLAGMLNNTSNPRFNQYQAERFYRRALQIRRNSYGHEHLLVATTSFHLGKLLMTYDNQQSKRDACSLLEHALQIRTVMLGVNHGLSKAVRKVLSNLQNQLCSRPKAKKLPVSEPSMSWNESYIATRDCVKKHSTSSRPTAANVEAAKTSDAAINQTTKPNVHQEQNNNEIYIKDHNTAAPKPQRKPRQRRSADRSQPWDSMSSDTVSTDGERSCSDASNHQTQVHNQDQTTQDVGISDRDVQSARVSQVTFQQLDEYVDDSSITDKQSATEVLAVNQTRIRHNSRQSDDTGNLELSGSRMLHPSGASSAQSKRHRTPPHPPDNTDHTPHRPATAPQILYQTYGRQTHSQAFPQTNQRPWSNTSRSTKHINYHFDDNMTRVHRQNCYIPTQHSLDVHNAYSPVYGPQADISSLLGPPPAPRPTRGSYVHTSAFYHAPGRYPTPTRPYPPRRSQSRLSSSSTRRSPELHPFNSSPWNRNY